MERLLTPPPKHILWLRRLFALCFCLLYVALVVCDQPFYAENKPIAMGTALARADIRAEELDVLLDAAIGIFALIDQEGDFEENVAYVYRGMQWMSTASSDALASAAWAGQHPREADKSTLSLLRYASVEDKALSCKRLFRRLKPRVKLDERQWRLTMAEFKRMATNIAALPQEQVLECAKILRKKATSADVLHAVSYKDMLKVAKFALVVTEGVDFSRVYMLDFALGEGFSEAIGADVNYLLEEIARLDKDRMLDAAFRLPDRYDALYTLLRYLFVEQGIRLDACEHIVRELSEREIITASFSIDAVCADIRALCAFPAEPTEEQWAEMAPYLDALLALLPPTAFG